MLLCGRWLVQAGQLPLLALLLATTCSVPGPLFGRQVPKTAVKVAPCRYQTSRLALADSVWQSWCGDASVGGEEGGAGGVPRLRVGLQEQVHVQDRRLCCLRLRGGGATGSDEEDGESVGVESEVSSGSLSASADTGDDAWGKSDQPALDRRQSSVLAAGPEAVGKEGQEVGVPEDGEAMTEGA